MRKEKLGGHLIEFYDNIDTLPIKQFHLYTKYILVYSGIGDGIEGIDSHINKIASYIQSNPQRAANELLNYRRCLFSIITEQDFKHKANMCLVKSVDGKKWEDFSDDGIQALYEMVTTESEREMTEIEDALKKKIDDELMTYFPELFATSLEKNQVELLRKRAMLQLAEIIDGVDNSAAIQALNDRIMDMSDTRNFEGKESAEIETDKRFEEMCLVISKEFGGMPKNYSVMEFYTANKMLNERQRELNKIKKK